MLSMRLWNKKAALRHQKMRSLRAHFFADRSFMTEVKRQRDMADSKGLQKKEKSFIVKRAAMAAAVLLAVLAVSSGIYVNTYYHADASVGAFLVSDEQVRVEKTEYGWLLDGPSEENAMVFYPGAKVEETAYAPLLHRFAEEGMDVCLVKMPFRLAFLGIGKASDVMAQYDYENWYIGGHSLGGAMSAVYAADHGEELRGLVLLAAYATKKLDDDLTEIVLYGSEDGVLNRAKIEEGREFAPSVTGHYLEKVIEGGNHAFVGSYGRQEGDGEAGITAQEQQEMIVRLVMEAIRSH